MILHLLPNATDADVDAVEHLKMGVKLLVHVDVEGLGLINGLCGISVVIKLMILSWT